MIDPTNSTSSGKLPRRAFLGQLSALGVATLGASTSVRAAGKGTNKTCFFTKHLQALSYDDIASVAAEVGVTGIEAPVRPRGHVEPERVEDDLPRLCDALKKQGLEMTIMTSGVNQVSDEQRTEAVLRTAKACGVERFRMSYFKYDLKQPIWPQLQEMGAKIRDLVQLCKEIGIQPLFQNHAGSNYAAGPVWDMYSIMREYAPEDFGFAFDIRHATVEGGSSWPLEAALVYDHMGAIYFKDFVWEDGKARMVPLGEGQVSPKFAMTMVERGYSGPISLHVEYLKGDAGDPAVLKAFREAHARDFAVVRDWMNLA
jgi:sugar phosphate isomerase/epimerase